MRRLYRSFGIVFSLCFAGCVTSGDASSQAHADSGSSALPTTSETTGDETSSAETSAASGDVHVDGGSPASPTPEADVGQVLTGSGGSRTRPGANQMSTAATGMVMAPAADSGGGSDVGASGSNPDDASSNTSPPDSSSSQDAQGALPEASGTLTVFYLDVGGHVMATSVEDPKARVVVQDAGRGPDGIAVDMDHGYIYWTGMGAPSQNNGFIRRSDLDGSNIVTIVPEGDTYTPKELKLDHENGKLYWSDREGMRVMRANLDGSELQTLVTTGSGARDRQDNSRWCVGIALDLAAGYVYWSQKGSDNAGVGSLRRAPIALKEGETSDNRSDIEVLFDGLPEPIDIDLDLDNHYIYWTDRGDDTINRAPIEIPDGNTPTNRKDREILVRGVREAIGVTLDMQRGKLYFTGGTLGRVGMADLDGANQVDLLNGTAGLTGIVVVSLPQ